MDEKVLEVLFQINQRLDKIDQRLDGVDNRLDRVDQRFDETDQKIEDLHEEMNQNAKEILDRQFLFETEYGRKIDAIFDSVSLEMDKNLEKSAKIRKLDQRVDRNEVNIFSLEKRVSTLELKQH